MRVFGKTDVGKVRKTNQDTFFIEKLSDETYIVCLCDGMGGENGGEIASSEAISAFSLKLKQGFSEELNDEGMFNLLTSSSEYANDLVYNHGLSDTHLERMGTTLVGGIVHKDKYFLVNIGDSRCYHIKNDSIYQITKDHSIFQEIMDNGDSYNVGNLHKFKNYLTRAIGDISGKNSDVYKVFLNETEYILLCSDGLHNLVPNNEIRDIIFEDTSIEEKCENLICRANEYGGNDNITVVIIKY